MTNEETQKLLDRRSAQLRKMIDEANDAADDQCAKGDFEASAALRLLAAKLTEAHAIGRTLIVGGIRPAGGGK